MTWGVGRAALLLILGAAMLCAPSARADDGEPAPEALGASSAEAGATPEAETASVAIVEGVPIAGGWFFPAESEGVGYAIVDEPVGPPFWSSFQQLGAAVLGGPISRPFLLPDGRLYQATQYALLVWRPGMPAAERADILDVMAAAGLDDWLLAKEMPRAERSTGAMERLTWLTEPAIRAAYLGEGAALGEAPLPLPEALARYGLPASRPQAFEGHVTQRFQRGALRVLTANDAAIDVDGSLPTAQPVPVGELLRESGLLDAALAPDHVVGGLLVARAPRPQLAWRSDTGWGIPAAPVVPSVPASTPVPPVSSSATAIPVLPVRVTPAASPPAAAASPTNSTSAGGGATRPPALPQSGAVVVIRDIVNQGRAEHVVVANEGAAAQELTGWLLRSATGGQTYAFPSGFVLAPGAAVNVHSGLGDPAVLNRPPADLFATRTNIWNNTGDIGQIVDPAGRVVSEKRYGNP